MKDRYILERMLLFPILPIITPMPISEYNLKVEIECYFLIQNMENLVSVKMLQL